VLQALVPWLELRVVSGDSRMMTASITRDLLLAHIEGGAPKPRWSNVAVSIDRGTMWALQSEVSDANFGRTAIPPSTAAGRSNPMAITLRCGGRTHKAEGTLHEFPKLQEFVGWVVHWITEAMNQEQPSAFDSLTWNTKGMTGSLVGNTLNVVHGRDGAMPYREVTGTLTAEDMHAVRSAFATDRSGAWDAVRADRFEITSVTTGRVCTFSGFAGLLKILNRLSAEVDFKATEERQRAFVGCELSLAGPSWRMEMSLEKSSIVLRYNGLELEGKATDQEVAEIRYLASEVRQTEVKTPVTSGPAVRFAFRSTRVGWTQNFMGTNVEKYPTVSALATKALALGRRLDVERSLQPCPRPGLTGQLQPRPRGE
jgi:hypothetical protein